MILKMNLAQILAQFEFNTKKIEKRVFLYALLLS